MKTRHLLPLLLLFFYSAKTAAQSFAINTDGSVANASAILDVKSTTRGVLIPRLSSTQRLVIPTPAEGLLVYDSTLNSFWVYDGNAWQEIVAGNNTLWKKNGNNIYNSNSGNVGIGTLTPLSRLHVADSSVIFTGGLNIPAIPGNLPVSGQGVRMFWYADKAAFRSGMVFGSLWNKDSIGNFSVATGFDTKAKGWYSVAMGRGCEATGVSSVALGEGPVASGIGAVALGYGTRASAQASTALGEFSTASGIFSTAIGLGNLSDGNSSIALGHNSRTSGDYAAALGDSAIASGLSSAALGYHNIASGDYSTASGYNSTASGNYSMAAGYLANAAGNYSYAFGPYSTATGFMSIASGYQTKSSGTYSSSLGIGLKAKGYGGLVTGSYNDSADAASSILFNNLNRVFQVGNGFSDAVRGNAMTILQNGNTGIGTVNPATKLHIAGAESTLNGENAAIRISNTNSTNNWILRAGATGTATPVDGFTIADNNAYRLAINSSGFVGIGTTAPAALLDVNGTTTTNGFQVSNGTVITKMQSGSVTVGSSASGQLVYTLSFPVTFATATPRVFATARNQPGTGFSDSFSVSVRSISATSVILNIQRTDTNAAWAQTLIIDWFAVE